jgi:hypothetical protein
VRRALSAAPSPAQQRYLDLLDLRFAALSDLVAGRRANLAHGSTNRALSRRFLEPFQETWDDGDENLVRGFLDRWVTREADPVRARARALLDCASELARMRLRPATLWFFLWAMESTLPDLAPRPSRRRSR